MQAEISVPETVRGKRRLFDLYGLVDTNSARSLPDRFFVQFMPGDGKIIVLCTNAQFEIITRKLGRTRFASEHTLIDREMRQMALWGVNITAIQKTVKTAERTSENDIFAAVGILESARHTLREVFNQDRLLRDTREELEQARALLAKIDKLLNNAVNGGNTRYIENYRGRVLSLGRNFLTLENGFRKGQRKIVDQVAQLRKDIGELYGEMIHTYQNFHDRATQSMHN
jgi:hypothetical protein